MACQLFPQMDFTAYARCFDITAAFVSTPHAFAAAFAQTLDSEEPYVIVAKVQQDWVDPMHILMNLLYFNTTKQYPCY
jgi:acetolactate synthase I/II/III large subunit